MTTVGPLSVVVADVRAEVLLGALGAEAESVGIEVGGAGSRVPVGALLDTGDGSATALGKGCSSGLGLGLGLGLGSGLGLGRGFGAGCGLDCGAGFGVAGATGGAATMGSGSGVIRAANTVTGMIFGGVLGLGSCCKAHSAVK